MAYYNEDMYPVQFDVDYPEEPRNRLTALVRIILAIPIIIVSALVISGPAGNVSPIGENTFVIIAIAGGYICLPTALMILFRKKYPRWWFDFNLEAIRFSNRINVYIGLLRDEYPSTDEHQAVHLDIAYPDAQSQLNMLMPLVKWLLESMRSNS